MTVKEIRGLVWSGLSCLAFGGVVHGSPVVIDDFQLRNQVEKALSAEVESGQVLSGKELDEALKAAPATCNLEVVGPVVENPNYAELSRSVFAVCSVYNCGKCDKLHLGGAATAWCLSGDGVMVTNYHVFDGAKNEVYGVASKDGKVWQVSEILAASKERDIAIFRVKGAGFQRLELGESAEVGDKVGVISHPDGMFFLQTTGVVSRYHMAPTPEKTEKAVMMSITADYAKGSSGGPVFNENGEVVGVVASTRSVYYKKDEEGDQVDLQMVIKNTIPVDAVREMIK